MAEIEHIGSVAVGDGAFEAPKALYVRWALGDDSSLRIRKWSQFPFDGATEYAAPQPVINPTHSQVAGMPGLLTDPAPSDHVPCPCTLIEQNEDCPVGYPSMICGVCEGKGHTTQKQVTALACEMIKIASDVGEPEDPFAAWESVSLIQSQKDQLRKALADMVPPKLTWKERDADGFLVHHQVAAINAARAALAAPEGSADAN